MDSSCEAPPGDAAAHRAERRGPGMVFMSQRDGATALRSTGASTA